MVRVLHISDLHMGWIPDTRQEDEYWDRFLKEVETACRERPVNMAVLTGDFCKNGSADEFARAGQALTRLSHMLGVRKNHFFFCRGNHDSDTIYAGSSFDHYRRFLEDFYGPEQIPDQGVVTADGVQVFSLNCCKKTSLARFDDAWLDSEEIDRVLELAEAAGDDGVSRKEESPKEKFPEEKSSEEKSPAEKSLDSREETEPVRVLLHHHQPEILDDQSQMIRLGASGLFDCMFSGHLHCYARKYQWHGLTVINGMAAMPHLDFLPRGFQIAEIEKNCPVKAWGYLDAGQDRFREYEIT